MKKVITIKLFLSLLYYDIKNKTYLTGRSRETGTNHEEVANMKANDDEEDASQIMQSVSNAIGVLKSKLSEYLDESKSSANNIPLEAPSTDSKEAVTIGLRMPSNFNESVTDTIAKAAHQYVVNIAVGDWFSITNKADAGDYTAMAGAQLEVIREAINKRVRPQRPVVTEPEGAENFSIGDKVTLDNEEEVYQIVSGPQMVNDKTLVSVKAESLEDSQILIVPVDRLTLRLPKA